MTLAPPLLSFVGPRLSGAGSALSLFAPRSRHGRNFTWNLCREGVFGTIKGFKCSEIGQIFPVTQMGDHGRYSGSHCFFWDLLCGGSGLLGRVNPLLFLRCVSFFVLLLFGNIGIHHLQRLAALRQPNLIRDSTLVGEEQSRSCEW